MGPGTRFWVQLTVEMPVLGITFMPLSWVLIASGDRFQCARYLLGPCRDTWMIKILTRDLSTLSGRFHCILY